eukprot:UN1766
MEGAISVGLDKRYASAHGGGLGDRHVDEDLHTFGNRYPDGGANVLDLLCQLAGVGKGITAWPLAEPSLQAITSSFACSVAILTSRDEPMTYWTARSLWESSSPESVFRPDISAGWLGECLSDSQGP